jgi:hypothetical protein
MRASQDGLHAYHQFPQRKRFCHVIIGAGLETGHDIVLRSLGRDHDNGLARFSGPYLPADGKSVQGRQHDVQENQIVVLGQCRVQSLAPIGRAVGAESVENQHILQALQYGRIVFDHQDTGFGCLHAFLFQLVYP